MGKKKNNRNIFDDFGIKATFDGSAVILNSNDFPPQGNKGWQGACWGTAKFAEETPSGSLETEARTDNEDYEFTEDWECNKSNNPEDCEGCNGCDNLFSGVSNQFTESIDSDDLETENFEDFEDFEGTEDYEGTENLEAKEGFDTDDWLDFDNSIPTISGVSHQEPFPGDLGFQPTCDKPWMSFGDNTDNNQIDCYDIQEYINDHGFYLDNTNKVIYLLDLPHVYKDMILTRTNKESEGYRVVFCILDIFDIASFEGTDMYLTFKEVPQVQSLIQGYIDAFINIKGV